MIRSLLFWNIFPLAPILLKTLIACQQRKIKNQSTTSERFNMCHIERVSTAYSHVIASPANCTISPSVWNVFLWNISQLGAEVLFNTLIYSRCMPECFSVSCVHPCCPPGTATRTEAPCSHWGEGLRREMKSQQFKEEIKTKLNLSHLKSGGGLCLFCAPFTDPSLFPVLLPPANSSSWHLPPALGCPACSAHSHKKNFHQPFPYGFPLQKGWSPLILPVKEQAPHASGWNKPSSPSDRQQFTARPFRWSTEIWMTFLHLKKSHFFIIKAISSS